MPAERTVKAKKRCCKSGPRCKRCPVVLKRLERVGAAKREGKRLYVVHAKKRQLKTARAR